MKIYDLTYRNKEAEREINLKIGKPYSFFQKIKMKGVGSRRLIVENFSSDLLYLKSKIEGIQYSSIELRPNGLLLHISQGLKNFVWVIPYYKLSIYNGDFFSIHSDGSFIHFNKKKTWKENRVFINKMMDLKQQKAII